MRVYMIDRVTRLTGVGRDTRVMGVTKKKKLVRVNVDGRTDEHAGPLNVVQEVLVDQTRPNWPGQVRESILDSDSGSQGVNW